jgi:hypothetical protein
MEGFCIPVRASALCGAIPLISDIASFREIHYTYSYFHKNTPASLALMITKVLDNISVNPNLSISTRLRALEAQDYDINIHSGSLISFD